MANSRASARSRNGGSSSAKALNNAGDVVGYSVVCSTFFNCGEVHAFIYADDQLEDLNELIDPSLQITLETASAINNSGEILATGLNSNGIQGSYLLTPIPESSVPEPPVTNLIALPLLVLVFLFGRLSIARRS